MWLFATISFKRETLKDGTRGLSLGAGRHGSQQECRWAVEMYPLTVFGLDFGPHTHTHTHKQTHTNIHKHTNTHTHTHTHTCSICV